MLLMVVNVEYIFGVSEQTAEMSGSETTTRVVNCEPQPSLSSVHRHTLSLPVVMPLSPLLATSSPGVTLRLWQRFYKPTPRDHMVALVNNPYILQTLQAYDLLKH